MASHAHHFDLLYVLHLINKRKILITAAALIAGFISGVLAINTARTYVSSTTFFIFFGQSQAINSSISGLTAGILNIQMNTPAAMIEALVRSRRMAEDVIENFFSEQYSNQRAKERLIRRVQKMIRIASGEVGGGALVLEVRSSNAQQAADIANFCVQNLDVLNQELDINPEKRFIKVLDPAIPSVFPESRKIQRKVFVAMLTAGLGIAIMFFLMDYIRYLLYLYRESQS